MWIWLRRFQPIPVFFCMLLTGLSVKTQSVAADMGGGAGGKAFYVRSTPYFDIVAADSASLQWLVEIAEVALGTIGDTFSLPPSFRYPIRLEANPWLNSGAGGVRVLGNPGGPVRLEIKWERDLSMDDLAGGVVEGVLMTIVSSLSVDYAKERRPSSWLVAALTQEFQNRLYPGHIRAGLHGWAFVPLLPVREIFGDRTPALALPVNSIQPLLLLRFLEANLPDRLFEQAVLPLALGGTLSRDTFMDRSGWTPARWGMLEISWAVWVEAEQEQLRGPVYSLDRSQGILRDALTVSLIPPEGPAGQAPQLVGVETLWAGRDPGRSRGFLERRLRQLKLQLPRINPVYFNALHRAGGMIESILSGDRVRFERSVTGLEADMERAAAMHAKIRSGLELRD